MARVDIVIPTYNRLNYLRNCVDSIIKNTVIQYRLFIVDDCSTDGTVQYLQDLDMPQLETVVLNKKRRGLTYGFDIAWDNIRGMDWFYNNPSTYLCFIQDDTEVMQSGWLDTLIRWYRKCVAKGFPVGFFSGHDAPEHMTDLVFRDNEYDPVVKIKNSMRATNMIGTWDFWESIGKVPRLQPNGTERGFPSPSPDGKARGRGSNFDVYLTGCQSQSRPVDFGRTTPNSCYHQKKCCMVIPGLVRHIATRAEDSTWDNKNVE